MTGSSIKGSSIYPKKKEKKKSNFVLYEKHKQELINFSNRAGPHVLTSSIPINEETKLTEHRLLSSYF
jgi:hypothetical protein